MGKWGDGGVPLVDEASSLGLLLSELRESESRQCSRTNNTGLAEKGTVLTQGVHLLTWFQTSLT